MRQRSIVSSVVLLVWALAGACSPEPASRNESSAPVSNTGTVAPVAGSLADLVPYGREPWPGIITAGQPSQEDFEALRDAGLRTVINLRVPTERGTQDEPAWIAALDLEYISIPVAGAAGLTEELGRRLDREILDAERPMLVHCGSSNRVGAAFALRAFYVEQESPEEALEVGRSAGLTKLEAKVRDLLD